MVLADRRHRLACMPSIGREFMPQLEEGNFWITRHVPAQRVDGTRRRGDGPRHARSSPATPKWKSLVPAIGRPDDGTDPTGYYRVEIFAPLKPMKDWPKAVERARLAALLFGSKPAAAPRKS